MQSTTECFIRNQHAMIFPAPKKLRLLSTEPVPKTTVRPLRLTSTFPKPTGPQDLQVHQPNFFSATATSKSLWKSSSNFGEPTGHAEGPRLRQALAPTFLPGYHFHALSTSPQPQLLTV